MKNNNYGTVLFISVDVSTEPLSSNGATPVIDYEPMPTTRVEFPYGVSSYRIVIPIVDDYVQEGREGFRMVLSQPSRARLGDIAHLDVYITDDDSEF